MAALRQSQHELRLDPSFHPHLLSRSTSPTALVLHTTWRPALSGARRAARLVVGWPERSQQGAVRNAMLAATALVERRIETDEVEAYLQGLDAPRNAAPLGGAPRS